MGKYDAYKEHVLRVSQALSERGYFGTKSGSAGNVSALVEQEEAVVVTPSGMQYGGMTADDICVVDFGLGRIDGPHDPSIETPMHVAVYKNRKDVNAVVHSHQMYASVLSVIAEPIPPLFDEAAVCIGNVVDVVPYGLSGSSELLENVVAKLANRCHCYILQNHGALCVGPDLDKTFTFVELLEKNATIYALALATGRPVSVLPEELSTALFSVVTGRQDMEIARKESLTNAGA